MILSRMLGSVLCLGMLAAGAQAFDEGLDVAGKGTPHEVLAALKAAAVQGDLETLRKLAPSYTEDEEDTQSFLKKMKAAAASGITLASMDVFNEVKSLDGVTRKYWVKMNVLKDGRDTRAPAWFICQSAQRSPNPESLIGKHLIPVGCVYGEP
jgi:hypothetical protein